MATQLKLVGGEEEATQPETNPVDAVFEFWRVLMEKTRAQLGPTRRKKIAESIAMGYSVDDLRLAIVGCKFDAWSQGQNPNSKAYNDIELICRDETRVDRFMELGEIYMKRTAERERKRIEAETPGVQMPDSVRARLDALFSRHREVKK